MRCLLMSFLTCVSSITQIQEPTTLEVLKAIWSVPRYKKTVTMLCLLSGLCLTTHRGETNFQPISIVIVHSQYLSNQLTSCNITNFGSCWQPQTNPVIPFLVHSLGIPSFQRRGGAGGGGVLFTSQHLYLLSPPFGKRKASAHFCRNSQRVRLLDMAIAATH